MSIFASDLHALLTATLFRRRTIPTEGGPQDFVTHDVMDLYGMNLMNVSILQNVTV